MRKRNAAAAGYFLKHFQNSNKMKNLIFSIFLISTFTFQIVAQNVANGCFEIKYLDFFGLDKIDRPDWSDKELSELLEMNYAEKFENTRFFIPMLVRYLQDFHPNCNKSIDEIRFNKLVDLYFKVRLKDGSAIQNKSVEEKLNYIRDDFYNLVKDDKSLPQMQFTFDDGPLYGETAQVSPTTKPLESISTDFGKLSILEANNHIFIVATDKNDKPIWSRIMKGANPDRDLQNLKFDKTPMTKTSLATIVGFYSEGERLSLYLKPNGEFMYYYHSW